MKKTELYTLAMILEKITAFVESKGRHEAAIAFNTALNFVCAEISASADEYEKNED